MSLFWVGHGQKDPPYLVIIIYLFSCLLGEFLVRYEFYTAHAGAVVFDQGVNKLAAPPSKRTLPKPERETDVNTQTGQAQLIIEKSLKDLCHNFRRAVSPQRLPPLLGFISSSSHLSRAAFRETMAAIMGEKNTGCNYGKTIFWFS